MLKKIRIQNYKSLADVKLDLQALNAFIGVNNVGKSNVFKAFKDISRYFKGENLANLDQIKFDAKQNIVVEIDGLKFNLFKDSLPKTIKKIEAKGKTYILDFFENVLIYSPEIPFLKQSSEQKSDNYLSENGYNLASFLWNLQENQAKIWQEFFKDFKVCLPEFVEIIFEKNDGFVKFGLLDSQGKTFFAEDLSDGVLLIIFHLSLVHQANSPKLLLIENLDHGIHLFELREIFELFEYWCVEKKIHVFFSTHNAYLLNYMRDWTDSVFMFEKTNGKTQILNMEKTIFKRLRKEDKELDIPPTAYDKYLGEFWMIGTLNSHKL